ncbi:MAG: ATP-grasp domain-containing protein [Polyangiaceae bacterium]
MTEQATSTPLLPRRVGILGGGQLALMLALAAQQRGCAVSVLTPDPSAPAVVAGVDLIVGQLGDARAVSQLVGESDAVIIESEFVDPTTLDSTAQAKFVPGAKAIRVAQDKLAQKRLFLALGIPTADFTEVEPEIDAAELQRLSERYPRGYVLKWSRGGYDGRGNFVVRGAVDLCALAPFLEHAKQAGAQIYAEALVSFKRELAMVATRSADGGEEAFFPLVITEQERGVCREVFGPATAFGVSPGIEADVRSMMLSIASALDLTGTFALELFLTEDGQLVANELAPRVHNSGHYTLWDDGPSQFDLHIEAALGLPLSQPTQDGLVLMRNLLGTQTRVAIAPTQGCLPDACKLQWYGKLREFPGRKMGHVTGRARDLAELEALRTQLAHYEWALAAERVA